MTERSLESIPPNLRIIQSVEDLPDKLHPDGSGKQALSGLALTGPYISLGRPEIFEKVAKIGVGCIFGSYKSPN